MLVHGHCGGHAVELLVELALDLHQVTTALRVGREHTCSGTVIVELDIVIAVVIVVRTDNCLLVNLLTSGHHEVRSATERLQQQ